MFNIPRKLFAYKNYNIRIYLIQDKKKRQHIKVVTKSFSTNQTLNFYNF